MRFATRIGTSALVLFVLYALSLGPFLWAVQYRDPRYSPETAVYVAFSKPMRFVTGLSPELEEAMERYLDLWVYR